MNGENFIPEDVAGTDRVGGIQTPVSEGSTELPPVNEEAETVEVPTKRHTREWRGLRNSWLKILEFLT
jgi:hypothetical protein